VVSCVFFLLKFCRREGEGVWSVVVVVWERALTMAAALMGW